MKFCLLCSLCIGIICYAQQAAIQPIHKEINILTEPLEPIAYRGSDTTQIEGIGVSIVGYVAKTLGHSYRPYAKQGGIHIMPWKRAYETIQNPKKEMYALFPMLKTKERENLFKWVGPIIDIKAYFFRSKNAPQYIKDINTFEGMIQNNAMIGVVKGYPMDIKLRGREYKNLLGFNSTSDAMSALRFERVHFVNNGELFYPFRMVKLGFDPSDFEKSDILAFSKGQYLAFSLNTPDHVIRTWQQELDTIKQNGVYDKLYAEALEDARKFYKLPFRQ